MSGASVEMARKACEAPNYAYGASRLPNRKEKMTVLQSSGTRESRKRLG